MPYAELNRLNMFYEEFGRGESVLFLHSHFSRFSLFLASIDVCFLIFVVMAELYVMTLHGIVGWLQMIWQCFLIN